MTQISVSTTFFPTALLPGSDGQRTDLILYTSDSVFFYCHQSVLRNNSSNGFGFLLPSANPSAHSIPDSMSPEAYTQLLAGSSTSPSTPEVPITPPRAKSLPHPSDQTDSLYTIFLQEDSVVFNLVLHMIYGMSCERYGPDVETVSRALGCLPAYGLRAPGQDHDIWSILLRQAPLHPLRVYALGGAHAIDSLCTLASQYTLAVSLTDLTEDDAMNMGAIYLRRIIFLHLGREDALRRTIGTPPAGHDTSESCTQVAQAAVRRGWLAAVGDVLASSQPQNIESGALLSKFAHLAALPCSTCKELVQGRIAGMIQDWVKVKRTI